jgi:alpha-galactosidase
MREEAVPLARGILSAVSQGGRPGFNGAQWVRLESESATETRGAVLGAHLAWSGDHELVIERDADNESRLLLAARLDMGEVVLAPSAEYCAPEALFHCGSRGRLGLRTAFHRHALAQVLPRTATQTPRKVHLNTWEALYFNQSLPDLCSLADSAAALGVERFVLDDGWFRGRRDDTTSLGDWTADSAIFPDGLAPLIAHVQAAGMDFGLWVEPEMVSPKSDLYRQHPDWCLALPEQPRPTQRHQLVLDLTRPEVADYLFDQLDALLRAGTIAYLKWDHNRELFPLAGRGHAQALAHYALLDRLQTAHPAVEIETCASGGGRVDFGVLRRCSRFWASDNNDPVERLAINLGWFQFLPPRVAGNHVGPSPNPVTGRQYSMHFRARVAMFGHMGVEADPRRMPAADFAMLQQHIAFYREWRDVLHAGTWSIPETSEAGIRGWFVWHEGRGLALLAQTALAATYDVSAVRFPTLDADARYRVRLPEPWPEKAQRYLAEPAQWRDGLVLSGAALRDSGLALPLAHPETAWLVILEQLP